MRHLRSARRSLARIPLVKAPAPAQALSLLALLLIPAQALPARASSPEAWASYDRQVRQACQQASGLRSARIRGQRVDLPSLGVSALLLEGQYPQPHMQGRQGQELCVYEQRRGKAAVADADSWRGAPPVGVVGSGGALR